MGSERTNIYGRIRPLATLNVLIQQSPVRYKAPNSFVSPAFQYKNILRLAGLKINPSSDHCIIGSSYLGLSMSGSKIADRDMHQQIDVRILLFHAFPYFYYLI